MITAARTYWILCAIAGVAVIALGQILLPMFPEDGAGYPAGYGSPVYAFEMAQTVEDMQAVFGMPGDPAREGRISDMVKGTWWDFAFLIAYGLFIAAFFLAVYREKGQGIWLPAAMLGVTAAGADAVENVILLGLMADLEAGRFLSFLAFPVWLKFFAIMLSGTAAGIFLIGRAALFWRIAGALAALGALTVLAAFYDGASFGWLVGNGITVCWVVQFVYAIFRVVRPGAV